MKKLAKYFSLFLILNIILISCNLGYEKKDGKVYYKWIHGGNMSKETTLVEDADAETFEVIKNDVDLDLGKDKNYVFLELAKLKADPATFEQIEGYYWRDKDNVYMLQYGSPDNNAVKGAEPRTFQVIKDNWGRDRKGVYHIYYQLENVDPKKFIAIDEEWGKDDKYYYYHEERIDSLDYKTAEIVSSYYIKDQYRVFCRNKIAKGANPKTFEAVGIGAYGHDDKYIFEFEKNKGPITEEYKKIYMDKKK